MYGNEDYMDEDGPEFIEMINDLVRNVRTEITTHPSSEYTDAYRISQIQAPYPSYRPSSRKSSKESGSKSKALGDRPKKHGQEHLKQSITTSKNLKKHLESLMSSTSPSTQEETFIVVDTNILISHQDHLRSVIADIENRKSCVTIVIPWVVLEELDLLKSRREGPNSRVAERAQGAVIFLQKNFSRKTPALRGQQIIESADTNAYENDDRILDCCRYFSRKLKQKVVLYSNDRNLCNKCMVHQIDAYGSIDQRKITEIVHNASTRRSGSSKQSLLLTESKGSSSSGHSTAAKEVLAQVKTPSQHDIGSPSRPKRSYLMENTSSNDSIYAVKSKSKRLQETNARLSLKGSGEYRSWNAIAIERYRNKQKAEAAAPKSTKSTIQVSETREAAPRPAIKKKEVEEEYDDCAMDIDDDFPPPNPPETINAVHAYNYS